MPVALLNMERVEKPLWAELQEAFNSVLKQGKYINGPEIKELEKRVSEMFNTPHAIGCASGSDALLVALMAIDIKPGDEVITTPFSFFATAGCIVRLGAKPVFVDIEEGTFNIDPSLIEKAITPKTKAIIPVHLFGQCAEMDPILDIAQRHKLYVIEDGAQSIGARYYDRFACTMGDIGTFSFFPAKNLGCLGDGGMVICKDDNMAQKIRILCRHGGANKYFYKYAGLNSRLDTLQAAFLQKKLPHLAKWSEKRRQNAQYYRDNFKCSQIILPEVKTYNQSIYNQFVLRCEKRDELIEHLKRHEIGHAIYYPLSLHKQECFSFLNSNQPNQPAKFPVAEKASREVLAIPIYQELKTEELDEVIQVITSFYS